MLVSCTYVAHIHYYYDHYSTTILKNFAMILLGNKKKFMMLWWQAIMTELKQFCHVSSTGNIGIAIIKTILKCLGLPFVLITMMKSVISIHHCTERLLQQDQ